MHMGKTNEKTPLVRIWEAIEAYDLDITDDIAEIVRRLSISWKEESISLTSLKRHLNEMWLSWVFESLIWRIKWNSENIIEKKLKCLSEAPRNTFKWVHNDWNPFDFLLDNYWDWIETKTISQPELKTLDAKLWKALSQKMQRGRENVWERIIKLFPDIQNTDTSLWIIFWSALEIRENKLHHGI